MSDWNFLSLEMDLPSRLLGKHLRENHPIPPRKIVLPDINDDKVLSGRSLVRIIEKAIPKHIKKSKKPTLCFSGHGHFHHYTYGLCRVLADRRSDNYGYIHIDQHHDMWGDSEKGLFREVTCGRFVKSIRGDTNASKVLTIGVKNIKDKFAGDPEHYHHILGYELLDRGLACIAQALEALPADVYISIDLDSLKSDEISTGWNGGSFKKETLFHCLEFIREKKRVIGIDVCGWDADDQLGNEEILYTPDAKKALAIHYNIAGLVLNPHNL